MKGGEVPDILKTHFFIEAESESKENIFINKALSVRKLKGVANEFFYS